MLQERKVRSQERIAKQRFEGLNCSHQQLEETIELQGRTRRRTASKRSKKLLAPKAAELIDDLKISEEPRRGKKVDICNIKYLCAYSRSCVILCNLYPNNGWHSGHLSSN